MEVGFLNVFQGIVVNAYAQLKYYGHLEAQRFGRRTKPSSKKDRKMKSLVLFGNVVFWLQIFDLAKL